MPEVIFDKVTVERGNRPVVSNLSFRIASGAFHVISGSGGSGKTTVLKVIAGLIRPSSGHVWIGNNTLKISSAWRNNHAGMIFQRDALFDSMTVYENVLFPLRESGRCKLPDVNPGERVSYLLDVTGLSGAGELFPSQLSGGMKKRAGIARALATSPDILLCDDPTAGLDPDTSGAIIRLILSEKEKNGMTVIWAGTNPAAVKDTGTSWTVMSNMGRHNLRLSRGEEAVQADKTCGPG